MSMPALPAGEYLDVIEHVAARFFATAVDADTNMFFFKIAENDSDTECVITVVYEIWRVSIRTSFLVKNDDEREECARRSDLLSRPRKIRCVVKVSMDTSNFLKVTTLCSSLHPYRRRRYE